MNWYDEYFIISSCCGGDPIGPGRDMFTISSCGNCNTKCFTSKLSSVFEIKKAA